MSRSPPRWIVLDRLRNALRNAEKAYEFAPGSYTYSTLRDLHIVENILTTFLAEMPDHE
jgi:hypothetical protein